MRFRSILIAALLVGGFIYFTSGRRWDLRRTAEPAGGSGRLWSEPDRVHTAGLSSDEVSNIEIYKAANAATVNITSVVYREDWFFRLVPVEGSGSGFLIDADGLILTNYHVVGGRQAELSVRLSDKSSYDARVLYRDPNNDLAILKIAPKKKLPFLKLGNSEQLQVGQKVLAIGNPFGLSGTLTTGVISALNRSIGDENGRPMEDMIQTDAAINPGNSGGPLLDSQGDVIGINTMIVGAANIGIGFALPINRAKAALDDYRAHGRYVPAYLGITATYLAGDVAEALDLPTDGGLLIRTVQRGSPAAEAGLQGATRRVIVGFYEVPVGGDFIVAVDGRPVDGENFLRRSLARKRPGDTMELTVYRDGRTRKVKVKLGEAPVQRQ